MKYAYAVTVLVALAMVFRGASLDRRPMHVDEAVHAIKFGHLLEEGKYRYDPIEYHGPTLNYFTLIPAYLTGQETLNDVTEGTLRSIPLFFGLLLLLIVLSFSTIFDRRFTLMAILLTAFSAPLVFYSRYYIQETLLVTFAYGLLIFLLCYIKTVRRRWIIGAGICLGLMHATKETSILFIAAMILSALVLLIRYKPGAAIQKKDIGIMLGIGFVVSSLFYSSFFSNWSGIYDSYATFLNYIDRAGHTAIHEHPWYYYLKWLFFFKNNSTLIWSELPIAIVAIYGVYIGWQNIYLRFIALTSLFLLLVFTIIPYKTPWNILLCWQGIIFVAAYGAARLLGNKYGRIILGLVVCHMIWLSWITNNQYESHQANPYVYAHTTEDIPRLAESIKDIARNQPERFNLSIQVCSSDHDYWPLPWYLRSFNAVGWYDQIDTALTPAPIIIASPDLKGDLIHLLYEIPPPGERSLYVPVSPEPVMLRHGVEIDAYVKRALYAQP